MGPEASELMRVLHAVDHTALRWAPRTALEELAGLDLVGEAVDSRELMAQAGLHHPEIVVLAWELPGEPATGLIFALPSTGTVRIVVLAQDHLIRREAVASGRTSVSDLCSARS